MGDNDANSQSAADRPDQRAAARSSLMFRAAKLLCESGEYACIVRDVSAGGARLRLFHAPPPETHLFLELGNGDRYAMERVWARDGHAGFRFSCSIEVSRFIEEPCDLPRRPLRLNLRADAVVAADGARSHAVLMDMSQHGACVESASKFALRQRVRLECDALPARVGFVRWRRGYRHGLVFQQALRLDELAEQALTLQPFGQPIDEAQFHETDKHEEAPLPLVRSA